MTEELVMWLWFAVGGVACFITSFLVAGYRYAHTRVKRRLEYAVISGLGTMAICYFARKYFPEEFIISDAPAVGIAVGLFGIGRVLDYAAQKVGLEKKSSEDKDNVRS